MSWELRVERLELQANNGRLRTYGRYQVLVNDDPIAGLSGHTCECMGPGINARAGSHHHLRIKAGQYSVQKHDGAHYKTVNYKPMADGTPPMPGLRLGREGTALGARTAILVHCAHPEWVTEAGEPPSDLWLSSVGCINLTAPIAAAQSMIHSDSRTRVIQVIDSLRAHLGAAAFAAAPVGQDLPHARMVVIGEPMTLPTGF